MRGERSKSHVLISYESKNVFVFSSFYCNMIVLYCSNTNSSSYIPSLTAYLFCHCFRTCSLDSYRDRLSCYLTTTFRALTLLTWLALKHYNSWTDPFRKRSTSLYVISTYKVRFLPENSSQNTALTKSELSSPVSSVHAWKACDHDPPFGEKKWLAFSDSGSPAEPE